MSILHQQSHNLQLSILKSFILQYLLNGDNFPTFNDGCLEDDTEGTVADDSFGGVGDCFVGCCGGGGGGGVVGGCGWFGEGVGAYVSCSSIVVG